MVQEASAVAFGSPAALRLCPAVHTGGEYGE
jgi:hypothetical protein